VVEKFRTWVQLGLSDWNWVLAIELGIGIDDAVPCGEVEVGWVFGTQSRWQSQDSLDRRLQFVMRCEGRLRFLSAQGPRRCGIQVSILLRR
jgi:hypothetical protein